MINKVFNKIMLWDVKFINLNRNYNHLIFPFNSAISLVKNDIFLSKFISGFDLLIKSKDGETYNYISGLGVNINSLNSEISVDNMLRVKSYIEDKTDISINEVYVEFFWDLNEANLEDFESLKASIPVDFHPNYLEEKVLYKVFGESIYNLYVYKRKQSKDHYEVEFVKTSSLNLNTEMNSYIDKKIGARLNGSVDVGFFIHVEDGYLRKIEGYTFYEDWPEKIDSVEFFEIEEV